MPRRDKTGPMGLGPLTGRRAGICRNIGEYAQEGLKGFYRFGHGLGCGFKRGMGMYRNFRSAQAQEHRILDQKEFLTKQAEFMQRQLEFIKKRLESMEERAE